MGVNVITIRDHFSGSEFWWGDRGGVWLLVSTASAALCIVYTYWNPLTEAAYSLTPAVSLRLTYYSSYLIICISLSITLTSAPLPRFPHLVGIKA